MATTAVARETIFALRREIAKIEGRLPEQLAPAGSPLQDATVLRHGGAAEREGAFIATGTERLDRALGGGLPKAALTEIHGSETRNAGVTAGFMLALASLILKTSGKGLPLLWIGSAEIFREAGFPYTPGLVHQFGIAPENLLFSEVPKLADLLWVAEEAAPLPGLAALFVELRGNPERLDLTATRRLSRRAEQAGRPVFLIRQAAEAEPTAAPVRLLVGPAPAAPRRLTLAGALPGSIGAPAFTVTIGKSRSALAGEFIVEWNSHDLSLRERRVFEGRRAFEERRAQDARRLVSLSRPGEDLATAPGTVMAFPPGEEAAAGHQPPRPEHATHRGPRRAGRGSEA
jgi:protein ImuA